MPDVLTESGARDAAISEHEAAAPPIGWFALRRPVGHYVVVLALGACAFNALDQGLTQTRELVRHIPTSPVPVIAFQFAVALTSTFAAIGTWRRASWAVRAIVAWGVLGATFVALLQPLLDLPLEALPGLLAGSVMVLAMAAIFAWYVRRDQRRP